MKVFHGLNSIPDPLQNTVLAIGVFDGVHLGHQSILKQTAAEAMRRGFTSVVLTFNIHPEQLLAPDRAPLSLTSMANRCELISLYSGGIQRVVVANFSGEFASLSPAEFVKEVLIDILKVRHAFVGSDFRFGKGRAGDLNALMEAGKEFGFAVTAVPPINIRGERISSTVIRRLVAEGNIAAAEEMLGHMFALEGTVVYGKKLGRKLGYPTANIAPSIGDQLLPADGIYAGFVRLFDGRTFRTAISIGTNPTTDTDGGRKIEAYIMDHFDENIYGQRINLEFTQKIRDVIKFNRLEDLKNQIADDVRVVGELIADYVI
jgi:riboflavin kinase/FMN adenylyltransferase